MNTKRTVHSGKTLAAALILIGGIFAQPAARAADHGDAPGVAGDQAADLADLYFFLDPADNTKAILITTFRGFIVPGEAVNFGIFDPTIRYHFEVETTGDAKPDKFIDITFSRRVGGPAPEPGAPAILEVPVVQTATIGFTGFRDANGDKIKGTFTAPATNPSLAGTAPAQVVTDLAGVPGVKFFAGEVDDPFFFDIPGFARFIASVRAGTPNGGTFNRARDTFAGYNVMSIALSVPVALLKGDGNIVGLSFASQRHVVTKLGKAGKLPKGTGAFKTVDREGVPAVNVALIPFSRKDEYNQSRTVDDANLKFGGDILATLNALGTAGADVFPPTGNALTLAQVAVLNGDILRLDTTVPNTDTNPANGGGGDNAAAVFPNGRRLGDDVIDILLTLINNGNPFSTPPTNPLGDNVNASDILPGTAFPFVAPAQQPRASVDPANPDATDDNTQN